MPTLLWLILALGMFQARAPAPPRASISGIVRKPGANMLGSTSPLSGVLVELKGADRSMTTGGGGTFTFPSIVPGTYTLLVSREGFVPDPDARNGVIVTVVAGQTVKDLAIQMVPAPAISGVVYDPFGEPLAAALVQAHARLYTPWGPRVKIVKKALTNDLGEFRLFWLNFGQYVVNATYGDRALASALGNVQLSANVTKQDDGYVPVFYGGSTESARAQAVRLGPGVDSGNLSINLSEIPRFKIKGRISPLASRAAIAIAAEGGDLVAGQSDVIRPNTAGEFEIRAVSPGRYVLLATADGYASDLVPVSVTRDDITGLTIGMTPTITVMGRITLGGPGNVPPDLKLKLIRRTTEIEQRFEASVNSSGAFYIPEVGRGQYDIAIEPLPPGTYLKSLNGRESPLTFTSNEFQRELRIELATATLTVEGHVDKGGRDLGGAQVVLIPETRLRRQTDRYVTGSTDARGNFQLTGVPPGVYTAYAFEDIEPGAYYAFAYSQTANARFAEYGKLVTVGGTAGARLDLKGISAADAAGGLQ